MLKSYQRLFYNQLTFLSFVFTFYLIITWSMIHIQTDPQHLIMLRSVVQSWVATLERTLRKFFSSRIGNCSDVRNDFPTAFMDETPRKLTETKIKLPNLNILGSTLNIYLRRKPHCACFLLKYLWPVFHLNVRHVKTGCLVQ